MNKVAVVLDKVVGSSGWCVVGPACAACGGCAMARLFPVDPQLSLQLTEAKK